jgi:SOS-response transcriptional repressor LexA
MNRLKELRTAQGLTLEALAKRAGTTRGQIWKLESEAIQLTPRWLDRLGKALGVPGVEILARPGKPSPFGDGAAGRPIPVIDYVQAGDWTAPADPHPKGAELDIEGMDFVFANSRLSDKAFALEIRGTSMEPEFRQGDRVIVDPAIVPVPGDYVVAKLSDEGEATFKKYRPGPVVGGQPTRIELVPLNPDWPIMSIDKRHPGRILATMVEHHRYRRL